VRFKFMPPLSTVHGLLQSALLSPRDFKRLTPYFDADSDVNVLFGVEYLGFVFFFRSCMVWKSSAIGTSLVLSQMLHFLFCPDVRASFLFL